MQSRFSTLALILLIVTGCAGRPPVWAPADVKFADRVELPLDLPAHGLPVITIARSADNDDSKIVPTLAIIDTGAASSIVTTKYAKAHRLDLRNVGDLQMRDALKQTKQTSTVAHFDSLDLAGAKFQNFDALADDFKSIHSLSDKIDLLLGRPMFENVLLTIDYPRRRVIIEHGSLPEPNGKDILPLKRSPTGALLVPIRLVNEDAWLILDTGHTGSGLLLSRYRLIALHWASAPVPGEQISTFLGETRSRVGRISDDVQLGGYKFHKPIVAISSDDDREYLGADFLRHFTVTIDERNNRVRFSRPADSTIETPSVKRFGFNLIDAQGTIEVLPGSAAQRAGLQNGDKLLSINGISVDRFNYLQREAIERGESGIVLNFKRDGNEKIIRVPLTIIVP